MSEIPPGNGCAFVTALDLWVLIRPAAGAEPVEWQEYDQGPGRFVIPPGFEACIRIKTIDDVVLEQLVADIAACPAIVCLNLSENRNVTDYGLRKLAVLTRLQILNLSSCDITNRGLVWLKDMKDLKVLNLSYCNRLGDAGLKHLRGLTNLVYLDLQGCPHIKHAAIIKTAARRGLTIHS